MSDSSFAWEAFLKSDVSGWELQRLGDLFSQRKEKGHNHLPLLAITGSGGVVPRDSLDRRDTSKADKSKYLLVRKNDIAYNTMRMWQGVSGLSLHEGIASPAYTICVPKVGISPKYAAHLFKLPQLVQVFHRNSQGMVDDTLNLKFENFSPIKVKIPSISEQQKIAAILSAVDEVVESIQAQINKLNDLKAGMMQELLTKGIGHTEFKDSPVGRIPKKWDCLLLDKAARRGSGHTPDKQTKDYWNGGIKWISLADSSKLDRLHISETTNEISELGIKNSSAVLHPEGTVVLSRDAGIGKSAVTTDRMAVSQHFMAWICGEKLNNYFLYYLLQLWKPRFENIAIGSTIKTIGLQYFKNLEIPLPSIEEQKNIANSLLSVDACLFKLAEKIENVARIKKALMQDLLTGKVRVQVN